MARALCKQGLHPLVIDARDRLFGPHVVHPLYDWRVQIERDRLLSMPLADVTGWHAPGLTAHAPGLARATRRFDVLILDSTLADVACPAAGVRERALLSVHVSTMHAVYALLKTRAATGLQAMLTGDPSACERIREACVHFLDSAVAAGVQCLRDEVDAIAALAVRMAHEEPGCQPRNNQA